MPVKLYVEGDYACFTRPEMKVERVSYDVMTPSAARGILEAIYWKPQMTWVVNSIRVLKPIRFTNVRRNEVSEVISSRNVGTAMKLGKGKLGQYVEDVRQQRASMVLADVAYIIDASVQVLQNGDATESALACPEAKHLDIFKRRARKGQSFHHPYFGCREFAVRFSLLEDGAAEPEDLLPEAQRNRDLSYMLHDIDFKNGMQPRFFKAALQDGLLQVPAWEECFA
ncbi:MAG: type I-C CRISPR-associated protein Cas5 [Opitutales bacterium]|nr:type I-C CRISPR-associated protein Cas5 [Opitutales bacterium]